jgi:hypothetical protein
LKINLKLRHKQNFHNLAVKPLSYNLFYISSSKFNPIKLNNNFVILILDNESYIQIFNYLNKFTSNRILGNPRYADGLIARKQNTS